MAKFTVTLCEIVAHSFVVDALNEEAAITLAYSEFDSQADSAVCISLGLDAARPPTVAIAPDASAGQPVWAAFG